MKDYIKNTNVVLDTLTRYQYPQATIDEHRRCYSELGHVFGLDADTPFSAANVRGWCEANNQDGCSEKLSAVDRLEDVYQHGRVLGNHLTVFIHPSEDYIHAIDMFFISCPSYDPSSKSGCTHFCCFLQYNGVSCLAELSYSVLEQYDCYLREAGMPGNKYIVFSFLDYHSRNGRCRVGYALFMHVNIKGKVVRLSDLNEPTIKEIEALRQESLEFPLEDFLAAIPDFQERLEKARYSAKAVTFKIMYLRRFYLFLDMAGLGYDCRIIDMLLREKGTEIFGTIGVKAARRVLDAFEEYTKEGDLVFQYRRRGGRGYDMLPEWYRKGVDLFIDAKRREKVATSTIENLCSVATRFYRFLASEKVESFDDITPDVLKRFSLQDQHKTIYAKNCCHESLRNMLAHLGVLGIVPTGLSYALPKHYADRETIVEILTHENRKRIEDYCANAKTPSQVRDTAMIRIAMDTGLRPSDIVGLTAGNLNFKDQTIRFKQQKTGVEHIAYMNVDTCNAIYRYMKDFRPKGTGDDHVFLSIRAPFRPLSRMICLQALKNAKVTKTSFRTLRKTYATDLARGGATVDEVRAGLGHSNTENVHKYLLLDEQRMRLCPLSLEETGLTMDRRYKDV